MKKSTKIALAVASTLSFASASSFAASTLSPPATADMNVKANIVASCQIVQPKDLDFGTINPKNGAKASETIKVKNCYTVGHKAPTLYIATGTGPTNSFIMEGSQGGQLLYTLKTRMGEEFAPDNGRYHAQGGEIFRWTSSTTAVAPVYGQVPANQNFSKLAGQSYQQTVHVQVQF